MTQLVKRAPPQQLGETPKDSVNISSGLAIYDKDIVEWRTFTNGVIIILKKPGSHAFLTPTQEQDR
jgi:hypothetical protein